MLVDIIVMYKNGNCVDNDSIYGRIALYGSTELTLPDDTTHPPDSIYTGLR